jgi:hypothetical protein
VLLVCGSRLHGARHGPTLRVGVAPVGAWRVRTVLYTFLGLPAGILSEDHATQLRIVTAPA